MGKMGLLFFREVSEKGIGVILLGGFDQQFLLYGHDIFHMFLSIWQVLSSCLQRQDESERKFSVLPQL